MREQLRALIKLAEIDTRARGIDERLQGIPAELDERRAALKALEGLVERQRAAIVEAERTLAQQDIDILSRNDSLSKAKAKSAKARTMREAEASERELDAVRKSIKDGEVEKDRLREKIAQIRAGLDEPEKTLAEQSAELELAQVAAQDKLVELRKERELAVAGREEFTKLIDKPTLRQYERLRAKLIPTVCEVVGETCQGCRMRFPPQRFIQLQKGSEIMQCQMCNRFVYHRESMGD